MKILIVEDGLPMAMGAQMILKANGHDADVAMTPTEAKQAVAKTDYEAIFMDFGLPEMDGLTLTRHLRDDGYAGLIIGLTANAKKYSVEKMIDDGLNACIAKPLTPKKLVLLEMNAGDTQFDVTFD